MKKLLKLSMLSPLGLALGLAASGSAVAQSVCTPTYTTVNNWGSGAQIALSVTNNGPAVDGWEVCWTFNGGETIANLWNGNVTTTGSNVCVTDAGYNANVATNGSASFGFNINNPSTQAPTNFTFNGASCGGNNTSSSVASSSVSSVASSNASSSAPATAARWLLDTTKSSFHFVTVKNVSNAEAHTFTQMQGTVANTGSATLTIPLASVSTGFDIRNTRMQNLLFESSYLPNLHFTTQLNLSMLDSMAVGDIAVQSLTGNLTLHAVSKAITFDATIVKHSNTSISVSPRKPIVVNSVDFEMNAGVEALRVIANLSEIGEKTPVYFKMFLTRDNPTNIAAITLPSAPATPVGLTGNISQGSGDTSLVWSDVSNNESGFLIRRKGADGRWTTQSNLPANSSMFEENLLSSFGSYDYKVISYRDSIPSTASAPVTLVYSDTNGSSSSIASSVSSSTSSVASSVTSSVGSSSGNSSSTGGQGDVTRGQALWTSQSCIACHGVDGEKNADGSPAYSPLNPNRSVYRHSQDNQDRTLGEFIELWMPQGNPGACTGQCAADLEAYILTWRRPSDGIPDNPVSNFTCPNTGPAYGQRTLRLLTKKEYQRSVRDLVGYTQDVISRLPDDFIAGSFENNNTLIVDKTRYTSYISTAERIAEDVATRWNNLLSCSPSNSCATTLVDTLGPRIFRRPLTNDERTAYLAVAQGTADGRTPAEGMQIALAAMLSSPQFLYRSEVGDSNGGVYKLNGYEMATYISYTFTGTTPSQSLMAAAGRGELDTAAGVRQHTASLLNSTDTNALLGDFVNRWLGTNQLEIKEKVGVTDFATVANDMKKELGKNFAYAMLNSSSTFESVYNPSYTHVNQRLANLYGMSYSGSGADADGFVRASTGERGGILISGAFLSRYATDQDANLVTRAVALRRRMMCQDIPEPPSGVSLDREALAQRDKEFFEDPHTTQRMIFDRITSGTSCSNCHGEIINPLGGSMENYDALGRVRATDLKGNEINAVGTFFSPFPQLQFLNDPDRVLHEPAITFDGGKDLARTIVEDPMVAGLAKSCLATQFVSYSSGIHSIFLIDSTRDVGYPRISKAEENAYRCDINNLTNVLTTNGPRAMLEQLPALDSVMYRQEWAR